MSFSPGKILVKRFSIINDYGTASSTNNDIWPVVDGVTIREHVFSASMSGAAKITDSRNLYNNLPITTDSYVNIVLEDPNTHETASGLYRIYKISDIRQESPKLQQYIIQFASVDLFMSRYMRISKHVLGNIPSAIEEIHKKYSSKVISVDKDAAKCDLLVPFMSAQEAISLLIENAKWKANIPDYCYWETFNGYYCKSLSSCMLENPIHDFATTTPMSGTDYTAFNYADYIKINELKIDQTYDELNMLWGGYRGNTVYTYDPLAGKGKADLLGEEPLANIITAINPKMDYSAKSKRMQLLRGITNSQYFISVPGLLSRSSGDAASVSIYNGNQTNTKDEILSGKRLILGITHVISCDDYTQNITLGDYQLSN